MLVLSRKVDESFVIGGIIEVMVVEIRGDKVRLGITAPKNIPVHRREVHEAIVRERAALDAAGDEPDVNRELSADDLKAYGFIELSTEQIEVRIAGEQTDGE